MVIFKTAESYFSLVYLKLN